MPKLSIRTNILIIFLLLSALLSVVLLSSHYFFAKKIAIESSDKTFERISKNIMTHLVSQSNISKKFLLVSSENSKIKIPITFEAMHPILDELSQIMKLSANISSLYFTQEDTRMFQLINLQTQERLFENYNLPKKSIWLVSIVIQNQERWYFLDKNLQILETRESKSVYDFTSRTWYKNALHSDAIIHSETYKFEITQKEGFTYALKLHKSNIVVALDYTLRALNTVLSQQQIDKGDELFIMDAKGKKFASSNLLQTEGAYTIAQAVQDAFRREEFNTILSYEEGEKSYYSYIIPLKDKKVYLCITVDANRLLAPSYENMRRSFFISLLFLVFMFPLIILSTRLLVRPIQALILENKKIQRREFSQVAHIKTNIIEYEALSDSFVVMSKSIQTYQKSQEDLLNSIIKLIAEAIDAKSPYTGGHCARVPQIAQLLLDAANSAKEGVFKEFCFEKKEELREFEIAAWLHDCGKVATPEYVVDKATKLETIYNRIHEIRMRFELLWRDAEIELLQNKITVEEKERRQKELQEEFAFVAETNLGGEYMSPQAEQKIKKIAQREWLRYFDDRLGLGTLEKLRYSSNHTEPLPAKERLLSDKKSHIIKREYFDLKAYHADGFKEEVPESLYNYGEVYNLCIAKGTLTKEERFKINEHVIMSIKMLEKIPFPKNLKNIPEYAGTHHETLIGTGYPRKLTKKDLSIPSRIMAIADIFEALTASDRPYKRAKTLSESLKIMSLMVKDQHIDADLFALFLTSGIYKQYAQSYLKIEQIDEVIIEEYLEYNDMQKV
jgi:HD-GYP domain-containing protein (c-di-GMP phosphodiesterase class II)